MICYAHKIALHQQSEDSTGECGICIVRRKVEMLTERDLCANLLFRFITRLISPILPGLESTTNIAIGVFIEGQSIFVRKKPRSFIYSLLQP